MTVYLFQGILLWSLYWTAHHYFQEPDPWEKQHFSEEMFSRDMAFIVACVGTICLYLWPLVLPLFMLKDIETRR